ncbi:unnamed protein product [Amoebophrya sp. A25]|nr:unnamed protein product [Amoebophrya sp. A25]|eukprot:GSA25T00003566001.1
MLEEVQRQASRFRVSDVVLLLNSLPKLGVAPNAQVLDALCSTIVRRCNDKTHIKDLALLGNAILRIDMANAPEAGVVVEAEEANPHSLQSLGESCKPQADADVDARTKYVGANEGHGARETSSCSSLLDSEDPTGSEDESKNSLTLPQLQQLCFDRIANSLSSDRLNVLSDPQSLSMLVHGFCLASEKLRSGDGSGVIMHKSIIVSLLDRCAVTMREWRGSDIVLLVQALRLLKSNHHQQPHVFEDSTNENHTSATSTVVGDLIPAPLFIRGEKQLWLYLFEVSAPDCVKLLESEKLMPWTERFRRKLHSEMTYRVREFLPRNCLRVVEIVEKQRREEIGSAGGNASDTAGANIGRASPSNNALKQTTKLNDVAHRFRNEHILTLARLCSDQNWGKELEDRKRILVEGGATSMLASAGKSAATKRQKHKAKKDKVHPTVSSGAGQEDEDHHHEQQRDELLLLLEARLLAGKTAVVANLPCLRAESFQAQVQLVQQESSMSTSNSISTSKINENHSNSFTRALHLLAQLGIRDRRILSRLMLHSMKLSSVPTPLLVQVTEDLADLRLGDLVVDMALVEEVMGRFENEDAEQEVVEEAALNMLRRLRTAFAVFHLACPQTAVVDVRRAQRLFQRHCPKDEDLMWKAVLTSASMLPEGKEEEGNKLYTGECTIPDTQSPVVALAQDCSIPETAFNLSVRSCLIQNYGKAVLRKSSVLFPMAVNIEGIASGGSGPQNQDHMEDQTRANACFASTKATTTGINPLKEAATPEQHDLLPANPSSDVGISLFRKNDFFFGTTMPKGYKLAELCAARILGWQVATLCERDWNYLLLRENETGTGQQGSSSCKNVEYFLSRLSRLSLEDHDGQGEEREVKDKEAVTDSGGELVDVK